MVRPSTHFFFFISNSFLEIFWLNYEIVWLNYEIVWLNDEIFQLNYNEHNRQIQLRLYVSSYDQTQDCNQNRELQISKALIKIQMQWNSMTGLWAQTYKFWENNMLFPWK